MEDMLDVLIKIRFLGDKGVTSGTVIRVLENVSAALKDAEEEELFKVMNTFPEIPEIVQDGLRYRLERMEQEELLKIESASKGSIILAGAGLGLAYWLADKTLGETVKDAWKDSELHDRLKNFLKQNVFGKRRKVVDRINTRGKYVRNGRYSREDEVIEAVIVQDDGKPVVEIRVDSSEKVLLPKPSEINRK